MLLPSGYWASIPHSSYNTLRRREPQNPDAPGLKGNKNGPPGPEGNQKGPPDPPEASPSASIPPASISVFSSSAGPAIITSSFVITSSASASTTTREVSLLTSSTPPPDSESISSSISVTSTTITENLSSSTSFVSTVPLVNPTSLVSLSSTASDTSFLASTASRSSSATETTLLASSTAKTTSPSSLAYTTSATAIETPWGYQSQNGTIASESDSTLSQGQTAGIAIGTLLGFSLILSLLYWLFKRRRGEDPKSLLRLAWRQQSKSPDSPWPRNQPFNVLPDSPAAEANFGGDPAWNYQETFARPPMIAKARQSLTRSLRFLRVNPLGMNPVTPPESRPRTPSRKSFASSFFHRRSTASTLRSVSVPACEEQPVPMRGPHFLRPLFIPPFKLKPASLSFPSAEATKSASASTHSLTIPPQTLPHPMRQQRRYSHVGTSSESIDPRSARAIFDRTRPRKPSKLSRSHTAAPSVAGAEMPRGSEKDLPPPLPLLPAVLPQQLLSTASHSRKRGETLRPSNSLPDSSHVGGLCANAGDGVNTPSSPPPPPPPPLKSPKRASTALSGRAKG
ncbi:uncharacterized protein Z519_10326 [Cladophialophora bantiana CBS 173.52]|uniref:REJ domain-containing protein n=1 Tax=Cladophialophora bantiana (strain ATCC 10958 / CBS 173.52 / CDC B-1940 / NIH 8579) TaxID=1442370 RepID=A0A0D2FQH5_CLAB1|nr:uncharacterized protein Z519_10326 [Cladophialophora bantiana CBS 173.52]KIW88842.1 hypothetical protein Z519_10326 [Cladophialophora bantiana CBS 173.52]